VTVADSVATVNRGSRRGRALDAIPDVIAISGVAVVIGASLCATLGVFYAPVLVIAVLALLAVGFRALPVGVAGSLGSRLVSLALVVGSIIWAIVQSNFLTEALVASRDPGVYLLQGVWLADHGALDIPVDGAAELATGVQGATPAIGPWYNDGRQAILLQGGLGTPAIVGIGRLVGGLGGALGANVVVGAFALIALYAASRRLVGPYWGVFPSVVLAVSMPMASFTRAPYSEILVLLLFSVFLVFLASALSRLAKRDFVATGIVLGSTLFVRVDSAIAILGAILMFAVLAFVVSDEARRRQLVALYRYFWIPASVVIVAAMVGYVAHAPGYVKELGLETVALVGLTLAAAVAVQLFLARAVARDWSVFAHRQRIGLIATISVVVLFAYWASRPLWLISRLMYKPAYQAAVASYQRAEGLAIDGARSYEEQTLYWTVWYFGLVLLLAAIAGIVLAVRRGFLGGNPTLFVLVGTTLVVCLLYFDVVRITPDQIWAYRRFMPFVVPGFLIAAAAAFAAISKRSRAIAAIATLIAVTVVAQAALVLYPMFSVKDHVGQRAETAAACEAIHADTVVLLSTAGPSNFALTLRVMCNVQVVTVYPKVGETFTDIPASLAAIKQRMNGRDLDVITFDDRTIRGANDLALRPTYEAQIIRWNSQLMNVPNAVTREQLTMWVGTVTENGDVHIR
jgi:hypothetical protein